MRLAFTAAAVVLSCGLLHAQDQMTKTRVKVEDGKTITVTGCVAQAPDGSYKLTDVSGKDGAYTDYILATAGSNNLHGLDKEVGHRLEVTGKAADRGHGKLKVETKTEGTTGRTDSTSEVKGDLTGLPFLGVQSFHTVASVCR
ncbi:MAG TPA: hypothetical protein VGL62_14715 [Vicinamibacterales bacterium]|jgi:hypothetical protein